MGKRGGINLYGFVNNDPINLVDPEGRAVYLVVIPGLIPHFVAVGDDGTGGSYYIDFGPRGSGKDSLPELGRKVADGAQKFFGPGVVGFGKSKGDAFFLADMMGVVIDRIPTSDFLDRTLLEEAKRVKKDDQQNAQYYSWIVPSENCFGFANGWLNRVRKLKTDYPFDPLPALDSVRKDRLDE